MSVPAAEVPPTGVLDTSTFILLGRLADTAGLPDEPAITTVTLAELGVGPLVARTEKQRGERQTHLQLAESSFEPIPFDAAAARTFARVAADLRGKGRKRAARAYDTLIAATALSRGLAVHTCNPDDFEGIDGLDVVEVPHPDR